MPKTQIAVYLDEKSLSRLDEERGAISRSQFLADLVFWNIVATDEQIESIMQ